VAGYEIHIAGSDQAEFVVPLPSRQFIFVLSEELQALLGRADLFIITKTTS
jgi:hypothetical protein